ncbi:Cytochrome c oxidase subunit 7A, mitochondrial [Amphibalanus amphitrite]|uniref:Cytochrome c oxidase subunit 7A, mitochondrial n=1 Tax=Amphibalanus amphitrite TaxID=1232801 RepID=A0A6A4VV94_AMPAM|nr:cytochrome c oxidase subunit 7A, mitochondrial-like [Amphibalanus amphitrite]KAF0293321.1 Cytochrome c oxidase subunit 7A, mitochondrial [Amphibalanus amphitrite]
MNFSRIALQSARRLTTSAAVRSSPKDVHPGYLRLREQYAKFQVQDGVPVHLKGGPADRILASLTYLLCAVAVGTVSYTLFYKMAYPQKK